MMKITGLSHLFKGENQHNWWLTKYLYSVFNNKNCVKATAQYQNRKIVYH